MFTNAVVSSTCHICLEELNYQPHNIVKSCCPTKAFICNECWETLKKNEGTTKCPICKTDFEIDSLDIEIETIEGEEDGLCIRFQCSLECNGRFQNTNKYMIYLLTFISLEALGVWVIILLVWVTHTDNTTFEKEVSYLLPTPLFWFISFFTGLFTSVIIYILYLVGEAVIKRIKECF